VDCCRAPGAEPFTEKLARRDARRLRRKGLDEWAQRLADTVHPQGASVLEVGAGVGGLTLELLRRGAVRAVDVDLSPGYERVAQELAQERGVADAVERRVLDFVEDAGELEQADVVVMHRVVCCTPDGVKVVRAAAEHARRELAFSFPRSGPGARLFARLVGTFAAVMRWQWRFYVHSPKALIAAAEAAGFRQTRDERGFVWSIASFERR
jgi:magnesium-protoporphyrin O-methyltransferase